ncbi:hypothetical protein AB0M92_27890 [Streptomyces sp. NPDC051582]|uniref:hypothetical protein n=1 Tax=Streptomyces sp. NPDC051582 TaxID=3155167 RepID=UPI00343869C9
MDDDFCAGAGTDRAPLAADHGVSPGPVQEHRDTTAALENAICQGLNHPPLGAFTEVPERRGTVIERWTRRLAKSEPTPLHALLVMDGSPVDACFVDPLTGMPALRSPDGADGNPAWRLYAPLSLPADGEELASVTLYHTAWITTSRGRVYPAPCGSSEQLVWHRWGGTPGRTAAVIDALLDDLGATVGSAGHHARTRGLSELLGRDHMYCAELGRDVLLEARRSPMV